jgi:branched-chain amino acid transport system permease protein
MKNMRLGTVSGHLVPPAIALVIVFVASLLGSTSAINTWSLWAIQSILAVSLVLVWGHGGIFSLGQTALYGLSGYAFGVITINFQGGSLTFIWGLLFGMLCSMVLAAIIGYFMFFGRVSSLNVAILTLAMTLLLYAMFNATADPRYAIGSAKLGGFNGMVGIPTAEIFGHMFSPREFFWLVAIAAIAVCVIASLIIKSKFGRIAAGVRSNTYRSELLGYDPRLVQWILFIIGAAIAGFGGALFASWGNFISPSVFTLAPAVVVLIWVLVGGRNYVWAAPIGVIVVEAVRRYLAGSDGTYGPIYLGVVLILIVLFFPGGLAGSLIDLRRKVWGKSRAVEDTTMGTPEELEGLIALAEPGEIEGKHLTKDFAGLRAVDDVTLKVDAGQSLCIIGPNGAGKSTLFSLFDGANKPTSGEVFLNGKDVTKLPPHRRARAGLAIKTQRLQVFEDLSIQENLWLAARTASGKDRRQRVSVILHWLGLSKMGADPIVNLSHGQQQWVDIGMVLANNPSVVLLDEPTAGMTAHETKKTAEIIRALKGRATVIAIEHDMEFVKLVNTHTLVLHLGATFAEGNPQDLMNDERIHDIYLGRSHA